MTNLTSYMGIQYHYILSAKKKKKKETSNKFVKLKRGLPYLLVNSTNLFNIEFALFYR